MQIDKKIIQKNLPKKGFEIEETHHTYFYHEYNGKRTGIYTYVSHGSQKSIGDSLIKMMKKQLKLDSNQQAVDLFKCPMSKDNYNDILKDKNLIEEE